MKIIPHSNPEPSSAPRELRVERPDPVSPPAPMVPTPDLKEQMKGLLQEFAAHAVEDIQALEQKIEHAERKQADQITKNGQAIIKLADELTALRTLLSELRSAPAATPPAAPPPQDPPRPDPMVPEVLNTLTREIAKLAEGMSSLRNAVADLKMPEPPKAFEVPVEKIESPVFSEPVTDLMASMNEPPRKVALLTKLWDYLNQVAFEIPLGRQSR